jgi:hypothetical protein
VHHQRRGITAKGEQEGEGVSRSLGWGNRREIRAGCPRRQSDVSGEELSEGQCRAVWNRDAGWDREARGAEANSVAATPGAIGRPQCGGTASTLAEDGGLATLSADNICMHFVKHAVS